jgi:SBP domain
MRLSVESSSGAVIKLRFEFAREQPKQHLDHFVQHLLAARAALPPALHAPASLAHALVPGPEPTPARPSSNVLAASAINGIPPASAFNSSSAAILELSERPDDLPLARCKGPKSCGQAPVPGKKMCQICLDNDAARKSLKSSTPKTADDIRKDRELKAAKERILVEKGVKPEAADGCRFCPECPVGKALPLSAFDGDNLTCRQHLQARMQRRNSKLQQNLNQPVTSKSVSKASTVISTQEFGSLEEAEDYISSLGHSDGVMYIKQKTTSAGFYWSCHCHGHPKSTPHGPGTSKLVAMHLTVC